MSDVIDTEEELISHVVGSASDTGPGLTAHSGRATSGGVRGPWTRLMFSRVDQLGVLEAPPSSNTSNRQIRKAGLRLAAVGLLLLAFGIGLAAVVMAQLESDSIIARSVALTSVLPGMAAFVIGMYRLVFATNPGDASSSAGRIIAGVTFGCGALMVLAGVLIGLLVAGFYLLNVRGG